MLTLLSKYRIHKTSILAFTVITVGALFYCYEFVLRIIPGALQSELSAAFGHISASSIGVLSAFYYFAYSPMQLPVGVLMDRFGPRRLLIFACFCCTLGSWMFTFTNIIWLAGAGRFLVGFGSSFAFVGVLTLTVNWLPKKYFSLLVGLITTLGMLGLVYGEVKITSIALNFGWDHVLYLMVVIGAILTLLTFIFVSDGPDGRVRNILPLPEFFQNVKSVLTSAEVWIIGIVGACLYTSLSVFGEMWGKTYLEQAHHLTKLEAAKTISSMFLGWAVGAPVAGYFSDLTGKRVLPLILGAVMALIFISIVLYCPGLSYTTLKILLFFYGLASGTEIIIFVMAKENSGAKLSGTVFAVTNMIVALLGGAVFSPLVGKLLDMFGDSGLRGGEHIYTVVDYQLALSILPISLLLVTIFGFFLKDLNHVREDD